MENEQQVKDSDALLSAREAARLLGVSETALNRLRRQGKLRAIRGPWGHWTFRRTSVMSYKLLQDNELVEDEQQLARSLSWKGGDLSPVIRMANAILVQALDAGASDIHIEPDKGNIRIRFRIDGLLREVMTIPKHIQAVLLGRYKQMAGLTVSERAVPQTGSISILHSQQAYYVRVACIPSYWGENLVLHLLLQEAPNPLLSQGFGKLGFSPDQENILDQTVLSPVEGLSLITGPTGAGVTTTAYNILFRLNISLRKIHTLERLTEYVLRGAAQSSFPEDAHYQELLQTLSRIDADILFLGDINSRETVIRAVEAALAGKRVIATMAAKDIAGALWRLERFGIDKETRQRAVRGATAQRLLRRVCPDCAQVTEPSVEERRWFGKEGAVEPSSLRHGTGCDTCAGTGYQGRFGVFETLAGTMPGDDFVPLRSAAIQAIWRGETTPEEVRRVLGQ